MSITPDRITLVGDGPFYTPMIQTLVAEGRYRHLRRQEAAKLQAREPAMSATS